MSQIPILVLGRYGAATMDRLDAAFATVRADSGGEAARLAACPDIRGVVSFARTVDADLMQALPRLEIVSSLGVGYEHVDVAGAAARGVVVTYTPDVLTEEVADTALALTIMTVRELGAAERYLRAGRWEAEGIYPLTRGTLAGRTLGIAGLGRIGKAIARRAEACGLRIAYHGRRRQPEVPYPYYPDLVGLARACDILISVLPGGAATRHLISTEVLAALGPDGVLINIGRGSVVDEAALIAALREGTILAAGLDVFENEPHVPAELIAMENAVLLPHVGSASRHTRRRMGELAVDNLVAWFETGRPLTPVPETPVPGVAGRIADPGGGTATPSG